MAHPEVKSGDNGGGLATRGGAGVLPRLRVLVTEIRHIGKESNRLDEVEGGLVSDPDEVYIEYRDERWEWEQLLPRLRAVRDQLGAKHLAHRLRMSERSVRYALASGHLPRQSARARLGAMLDADDNARSGLDEADDGL